jgi:hypothetical protein
MHRIDTPTAQKDKFGAGKNGFTAGNPQTGTPATDLDNDYFDMLQEELAGVVEATGVNLDKSKHNQLLTALKALLLSRAHPFADIKADGAEAIAEALSNLDISDNTVPVGVPMPWPLAVPPQGWLKCNGAPFTAAQYPKLAAIFTGLHLPDLRGEFIRGWDDGRGIDAGRVMLTLQNDAIRNITGEIGFIQYIGNTRQSGALYAGGPQNTDAGTGGGTVGQSIFFNASRSVPTAEENRPRNISYNYIIRAA